MSSAGSLDAMRIQACSLAYQAGAAILEIYARDNFDVERKRDDSPLTAADLAAHRVLVQGLRQLDGSIPVLSEESARIPWDERRNWERYWLVDPLDGTREFLKRNGEFSVNIALVEDGCPVIGVVLVPVSGELCWAQRDRGAFRHTSENGSDTPIGTRPAARPPVVAGSRSHTSERERAMLEQLGEHERRGLGSSLKFLLLARGEADLYLRLGPTSEWDTAAAQCVLEQAGGAVLDLAGEPFRYNRGESLINPSFIAVGDPSVDWLARLGARADD